VLSTKEKIYFIQNAVSRNFKVNLVYITTSNPQINISRNKQRAQKGGHNVPDAKIIERYWRGLKLLPEILEAINGFAFVIDNSRDKDPLVVLVKGNGVFKAYSRDERPSWVDQHLISHLNITHVIVDTPNKFQTIVPIQQGRIHASHDKDPDPFIK
jgi:predicted ABC-type ATPase